MKTDATSMKKGNELYIKWTYFISKMIQLRTYGQVELFMALILNDQFGCL